MSSWQETIDPNSTSSMVYVPPMAPSLSARESAGFQPQQLLSVLDLWLLNSTSPVFILRGQDTLTIGDQWRWKQARVIEQMLQHPARMGNDMPDSSLVYSSLTDLPKIYLRNVDEVRAFLAGHPQVDRFLRTCWPILVKHFGRQVEVALEVMCYPGEQVAPELVAWIQCSDPVPTGLAKLDAFQEEWFLDQIDVLNARFNFNLDFV